MTAETAKQDHAIDEPSNVLGGTSLVAALANAQVKADEGEA